MTGAAPQAHSWRYRKFFHAVVEPEAVVVLIGVSRAAFLDSGKHVVGRATFGAVPFDAQHPAIRRMIQPNDTSKTLAQDDLIVPVCARCGGRMLLTCSVEEYPGYNRQVFECSLCGGAMTRWAGASSASD